MVLDKIIKLLFIVFCLSFTACHQSPPDLAAEVRLAIVTGENSHFVHIGTMTREMLQKRKDVVGACEIKETALRLDTVTDVDEKVKAVLIKCPNMPTIGLRVQKQSKDKYHILGFWTVG